jgi:hypothetical protein
MTFNSRPSSACLTAQHAATTHLNALQPAWIDPIGRDAYAMVFE